MVVAGQGVFQRKAWEALTLAAEKNDLIVATSGPTRGAFPDDHRLCANTAPDALMSADLVVFIGQYCMPSPGEYRFGPDVKAIRVHPEQEDLGRNWPLDLGVVSDEKIFLESLAEALPKRKRDVWTAEVAKARKAYEDGLNKQYELGLKYSRDTNHLHPAVMSKETADFLYKGDIDPREVVTGSGGWTSGLYAGRWLRANRPGQSIVPAYQYGAIGPDLAVMMGAGAAVQRGVGPQAAYKGAPVLSITSDAGVAYSMFEFDTVAKYKIPVICIVYNNDSWGMWPMAVRSPRSMHMYLFQENLRYDKVAEGLGVRGEFVQTPEQFRESLARSYKLAATEGSSTLINVKALKEFTSASKYPPGVNLNPEPGVGAVGALTAKFNHVPSSALGYTTVSGFPGLWGRSLLLTNVVLGLCLLKTRRTLRTRSKASWKATRKRVCFVGSVAFPTSVASRASRCCGTTARPSSCCSIPRH